MNSHVYNAYMDHNQNMYLNNHESINNNLNSMANNNLLDLSIRTAHTKDLSVLEGSSQTEPRHNKVSKINTKGARKIMTDQKGPSHESAQPKIPKQDGSSQIETFHVMTAVDVRSEKDNNGLHVNYVNEIFDDVSSDETHNEYGNGGISNETSVNYSKTDDSIMTKIENYSEMNKAIIRSTLKSLSILMLYNIVEGSNDTISAKYTLYVKVFQILVKNILEIVHNAPDIYMEKSTSNESTQTEINNNEPPILNDKATQTDASDKVHQNKDLNKEQNARYFHNSTATNQNLNVYNNHNEQFYDNQQIYSQLQMDQNYVVQPPMMEYGMPYTTSAMMQRAESGNSGMQAMQMMTQCGMPHAGNMAQPTHYSRRMSANVPRQEMPRSQSLMQNVPRANVLSQVCGRRPRGYYSHAANPPYPACSHRLMFGYQELIDNNKKN